MPSLIYIVRLVTSGYSKWELVIPLPLLNPCWVVVLFVFIILDGFLCLYYACFRLQCTALILVLLCVEPIDLLDLIELDLNRNTKALFHEP